MTEAYWPFTDPLYPLLGSTTAPVDQLAAFQPDIGAPITRPRTTAQIHAWDAGVILYDHAQFKLFEEWFANDLAQGARPFYWLDPIRQELRRFKFREGSYGVTFLGAGRMRISMPLLMLPGINAPRTADTLTKESGTFVWIRQLAPTNIGDAYTASTYLKQGTAFVTRFSAISQTTSISLANMVIDWSDPEEFGEHIWDGWYRFDLQFTAQESQSGLYIYPAGTVSGAVGSVIAWGAQVNPGPLQPYVATGSEIVAGQNLLTHSEEFDNAAWAKNASSSVTPNTTIAPNSTILEIPWLPV